MIAIEDRGEWDAALLSLPAAHVLQTFGWGEQKSRWGWSAERFLWRRDERVVAAAQVLVRRVGGLPLAIGYVPKGPVVDRPELPAAWDPVLPDLEAWSRRRGLATLKIDPDVQAAAAPVAEAWACRGWRPSDEQIQFPNTMLSDLSVGEDALLSGMKPKTRYNVRLAARRGVTVRRGGHEDLDGFFALYAETAARDGFAIRSADYYRDAWAGFLDAGRATVILAEHEGRALAGVIPVQLGSTAWFLYGATASAGRRHMPAYLAQWESLRWALERGCDRYDWWGGPTALDAADPLWGVYRFKAGFGAQWVEQLGAWDFPVRPLRAAAFRRAKGLRLAVLRRWG